MWPLPPPPNVETVTISTLICLNPFLTLLMSTHLLYPNSSWVPTLQVFIPWTPTLLQMSNSSSAQYPPSSSMHTLPVQDSGFFRKSFVGFLTLWTLYESVRVWKGGSMRVLVGESVRVWEGEPEKVWVWEGEMVRVLEVENVRQW